MRIRKILSALLIIVFCLTLFPAAAMAEEEPETLEVTVGDGEVTHELVPINSYYKYGKTQYIIPASELTELAGKNITAMRWYIANHQFDCRVTLILSETELTSLTGNNMIDVSGETLVYDGAVKEFLWPVDENHEVMFTFDTPYAYKGGNLLVTALNVTGRYGSKNSYYGIEQSRAALMAIRDNAAFDASYDGTGASYNFLPKTTLYSTEPKLELETEDMADGNIRVSWNEIPGAVNYAVYAVNDGGGMNYLWSSYSENEYVDTRDHLMGDNYSFYVEVWLDNDGENIVSATVDDLFNPFADVEDDSPYFDCIAWAYNNEIVKGSLKDDGLRYFDPDGSTTRMNFVMILYKMHGSPKVKGKNPFKDVTGTKSIKAVLWAYNEGLVKGTDKKHFSPDMNLSRMNIIMILYKLAGSPSVSGENPFVDISGSKTIKAVTWAVQKGIITGVDDTHFEPDGDCSRALFVDVLYKYNAIYKILK